MMQSSGDEWEIRHREAVRQVKIMERLERERQAAAVIPAARPLSRCDICGRQAQFLMGTSYRGSACANCYDRVEAEA